MIALVCRKSISIFPAEVKEFPIIEQDGSLHRRRLLFEFAEDPFDDGESLLG